MLSIILFFGLATIVIVYELYRKNSQSRESARLLSLIPTVQFEHGDDDRSNYLYHHKDLVRQGYETYTKAGKIFKVKNATGSWKIILPREYLMEIKHAANNTLSWQKTMADVMMLQYTGGPDRAAWSARALRVEITKRLPKLEPDMLDGLDAYFEPASFIPKDGSWHEVQIHNFFANCIARITNRIFSGPELASDPEWIEATKQFTKNAWTAASKVRLQPDWKRRMSTWWLPEVKAVAMDKKLARDKIRPLFDERIAGMKGDLGPKWERPQDGFQWLLNTGGPDVDFDVFVDTLMRIMMASIHITAAQATLALAHMLARPEWLQPLRQECLENLESGADVTSLVLVTSFIKESMRHHASGVTLAGRKAVNDQHVFSDGTVIPKNTVLWAPVEAINHDADIYPNPEMFDPTRFAKLREGSKEAYHKWELANAHEEFLNFGYGSQACPGRWFAERELCLIFRKLLSEYEMVGSWQGADGVLSKPTASYIDNTLQSPERFRMHVAFRGCERMKEV